MSVLMEINVIVAVRWTNSFRQGCGTMLNRDVHSFFGKEAQPVLGETHIIVVCFLNEAIK